MPPRGPDLSARLSSEAGVPVVASASARAVRLSMRLCPRSGAVAVSVPGRASDADVSRFVREGAGWIRAARERLPRRVPFDPGERVPVRGVMRTILQDTSARFPARLDDASGTPAILVGATDFPAVRVGALLRREALSDMRLLTAAKAAAAGLRATSVAVKDTSSRWGSCSASGDISYSWRLVMAPPEIADYLASHEVAHLAEMNHGRAFWRLCASLSATPPARASAWLRANGASLLRLGPA